MVGEHSECRRAGVQGTRKRPRPAVALGSESSAAGRPLPLRTVFSSCVRLLQKRMHFSLRVTYSFLPRGRPSPSLSPAPWSLGGSAGALGPSSLCPQWLLRLFQGRKAESGPEACYGGVYLETGPPSKVTSPWSPCQPVCTPRSSLGAVFSPGALGVSLRRRDSGALTPS